ncbi:hypothetical protein [Photorhabdus heterorhabditis]|uniref:AbiTii domain-containing protein n=1 Tax=Photorhabdus heterorhabditis TaxID=880156 RepID=UPI001BD55889|nr:hypothetical protein [Photorhabdus heterorhabditis]MBS9441261.1 hypothetical protein [Photorhabdus heterorhabditis]
MDNSPVLELQSLASDPSSNIVAVLLKAKMIAIKLGLDDLSEWLEYEIGGYPPEVEVPDYRTGKGVVKALNPLLGWIPVDFGDIPPNVVEDVLTYRLTESISSMQNPHSENGWLRLHMSPHCLTLIFGTDNPPAEACWFFSANKLGHIVTTVRNKVLTWSLELEKKGIFGECLLFTQKEKAAAPMTINNTNNFLAP